MGGENKTTTTNESGARPAEGVNGLLDAGYSSALSGFNSGQRTRDMAVDASFDGLRNTANRARVYSGDNNLGTGAISALSPLLGTGGFNSAQTSAMGSINPFAQGNRTIDVSVFDELAGNRGPSMSESNLSGIARGDMLSLENADFERLLGKSSEMAATEAAMAAGASGRAGSPYAQRSVADTVGDLQARTRFDQYNNERDRQVQANSLIDQMRQAGDATRLSAAGARAGYQSDDYNRQMAAIQSQFGMGQQGTANLLGIGGSFDSLYGGAQAPNMDLMSLNNMPAADYETLFGAAGAGLPYATQWGQGSSAQPTNWAGLIGGTLLGGASLLRGGV